MSVHKLPPKNLGGILKELGPGLIISANIVGSGELIVTTKLGADVGFTLLWFIILGCMVKVFLQVELGRYTILNGKTTLEALNGVPGPRFGVSWLVWCWLLMFVATFFQLSGMVGGIAGVFQTVGSNLPNGVLALLITGSCAILLFVARYEFIERFSTTMVAGFTIFTILAVFSLYWTDFGITGSQLAEGLRFGMPDDFIVAFAAFGVIGVGATELIFYPYWCLEKGYARYVGPRDSTAEWVERARGWMHVLRWDAWISMVIYTGATIAFYLLGAAVLNAQNLTVENTDLIPTLSGMYSEAFGIVGLWVFLIGAFAVLYSTIFISTAGNTRLSVDVLRLFGLIHVDDEERRRKWIRITSVGLPSLYFFLYIAIGSPVSLVLVGAIAQALMLPLLCFGALHYLNRETDPELHPSKLWVFFLWLSAGLMTATGVYQLLSILNLI
jgi:Mn2+/Fe2+ NRAMP family transporter